MVKPLKRLQMGKNGLSPAFVLQVKQVFEHERVVKISLLKSACRNRDDAVALADALVEALGKLYDYKLVGYVITLVKYRKAQW